MLYVTLPSQFFARISLFILILVIHYLAFRSLSTGSIVLPHENQPQLSSSAIWITPVPTLPVASDIKRSVEKFKPQKNSIPISKKIDASSKVEEKYKPEQEKKINDTPVPQQENITEKALQDAHQIAREIEKRNQPIVSPGNSLQNKYERAFASLQTQPGISVNESRLADGKRIARVSGPLGTYCVIEDDKPKFGAGENFPKTRTTTCP